MEARQLPLHRVDDFQNGIHPCAIQGAAGMLPTCEFVGRGSESDINRRLVPWQILTEAFRCPEVPPWEHQGQLWTPQGSGPHWAVDMQ